MKMKLLAALVFLALFTPAHATQIDGVNVLPKKSVAGKTLLLNGAGVRTVILAIIPIKAYVAAFYAPAPLRTEQAVLASSGPFRFDFTFLQGVGQKQVTEAWTAQFKASGAFTYAGYERDREAFIGMFGPLRKYGVETVVIEGNQTQVYDGGMLKGAIQGRNFQKAFLSLWFGATPVQSSLKTALLGH